MADLPPDPFPGPAQVPMRDEKGIIWLPAHTLVIELQDGVPSFGIRCSSPPYSLCHALWECECEQLDDISWIPGEKRYCHDVLTDQGMETHYTYAYVTECNQVSLVSDSLLERHTGRVEFHADGVGFHGDDDGLVTWKMSYPVYYAATVEDGDDVD